MGAEIIWPQARRIATIRFGSEFNQSATRDPYSGCAILEDHGDHCVIGPLAGVLTEADHNAILEQCLEHGFERVRVERRGKYFEYDLSVRPFRRKRVAMPAPQTEEARIATNMHYFDIISGPELAHFPIERRVASAPIQARAGDAELKGSETMRLAS